jgi:hypothetical protein
MNFNLESILSLLAASLGSTLILAFYFFVNWDARRPDSPYRADTQIGLKVALYTFFLVAIGFAAMGLTRTLHYMLSGAATSTESLKSGLAALLTGTIVTVMVWKGLLPRTNDASFPKTARLAYGTLAATSGVALIASLVDVLQTVLLWPDWTPVAGSLADTIVLGLLTSVSLLKFGRMSGWVAPQPPPPQAPQYPPQGYQGPPQGYPPPGYPPQGGYPPPAGGGYPPPGGGYPPR